MRPVRISRNFGCVNLLLLLCLALVVNAVGNIMPNVYATTIIQEDGWETGNLSKWTGNQTVHGRVSVDPGIGRKGSVYALNASLDARLFSGQKAQCWKQISPIQVVSQRMYVKYRYNLLNESGQRLLTYDHQNSAGIPGTSALFSTWGLAHNGTGVFFYFSYLNDSSYEEVFINSPIPQLDAWYALEFRTKVGHGDGEVQFYINDVLKANITGLVNDSDYTAIDIVVAGLKELTWGNYPKIGVYIDDFKATDGAHVGLAEPSRPSRWQMTFNHLDMDSNAMDSKIVWQLYNASQLLTYTEGDYTLLNGTYILETFYHETLINSTNLSTATYGNTTVNILLQMKAQRSVQDGYIAFNNTITSITINEQTSRNLTFTVSGLSPVNMIVDAPNNASYVQKDNVNETTWAFGQSSSPAYIKINASSLSTWKFIYPMFLTKTLEDYNTQLKNNGDPYIIDSTETITALSSDPKSLTMTIEAPSEISSTTQLNCSNRGEPKHVHSMNGTATWNYNSSNMILTLNVSHIGPADVFIDWRIPGDVNGDGTIDISDLSQISAHWYPGPPMGPLPYNSGFDLNSDGSIDVADAAIVSAYWTGPPKGPLAQ